jgi:hypothetical protein
MRGGKQVVRKANLAAFWGKDGELRLAKLRHHLLTEWKETIRTKADETFYQTNEAILSTNGENRVNIRLENGGERLTPAVEHQSIQWPPRRPNPTRRGGKGE